MYDLCILTDVTGAYGTKKALASFKAATSNNAVYYKKIAVIGAEGIVKFFFNVVKTFSSLENARLFEKKEEAIAWLTE